MDSSGNCPKPDNDLHRKNPLWYWRWPLDYRHHICKRNFRPTHTTSFALPQQCVCFDGYPSNKCSRNVLRMETNSCDICGYHVCIQYSVTVYTRITTLVAYLSTERRAFLEKVHEMDISSRTCKYTTKTIFHITSVKSGLNISDLRANIFHTAPIVVQQTGRPAAPYEPATKQSA